MELISIIKLKNDFWGNFEMASPKPHAWRILARAEIIDSERAG